VEQGKGWVSSAASAADKGCAAGRRQWVHYLGHGRGMQDAFKVFTVQAADGLRRIRGAGVCGGQVQQTRGDGGLWVQGVLQQAAVDKQGRGCAEQPQHGWRLDSSSSSSISWQV
jgi:hypothetical protein